MRILYSHSVIISNEEKTEQIPSTGLKVSVLSRNCFPVR